MLRWLGPKKLRDESIGDDNKKDNIDNVTDDPLAAIDFHHKNKQIYSISRVNPLYTEGKCTQSSSLPRRLKVLGSSRHSTPMSAEKLSSSGYEGSGGSVNYVTDAKLTDTDCILEQNGNYVKSIQVSPSSEANKKKMSSHFSGSSGAGTLTTILEGRTDFTIPRPIWPKHGDTKKSSRLDYDSLVDEAVMLYTNSCDNVIEEQSLRDVLIELLNSINATIEGKGITPEEMLRCVNEKLKLSVEALKNSTEEEMRKLCIGLSNSKNISSVVRAFSNRSNSTSGNSSQSSPKWNSERIRTNSSGTEDLYQIASGSSSSGFSDSVKHLDINQLPVFVHENLASVPNGVRNAMIYGTLCRTNFKSGTDVLIEKDSKSAVKPKKSLLLAANDDKPSVWEQYYGVNAALEAHEQHSGSGYIPKPTDVPIYPGGRPETDFTLDVHRSEILTKRLKADKKWRCRCRIVTSILGVLFFLASVMAVSLVLTRGKRMFGSMV
ncbi:uncharacterized protein [Onthophagus taurus]|uniref:uncharacterized protein isoform X2 n=1 Tax=Onthophagus taurus TaxID=166361 RepID=UPI000C201D3D|nr:uncharacterized protein LOC111414927 isoform X2 [Onthophagus taurus]